MATFRTRTTRRPWQAVVNLVNPQTGLTWTVTSYHSSRELAERRVEKYPPRERAPIWTRALRLSYSILDTRE